MLTSEPRTLRPMSLASITTVPAKLSRREAGMSAPRIAAEIRAETASGSFGGSLAETLEGKAEYGVGPSIARTFAPTTS